MFTGLIEEMGTLRECRPLGRGLRLTVGCSSVLEGMAVGDSLAINGVCQTVVALGTGWVAVEAVGDTLTKTTLGDLRTGTVLNLERACRADGRLGGHFVLGHVQAVGTVADWSDRGASWNLEVTLGPGHRQAVVAEGSITVDGISLTVAGLTPRGFRVSVIPHTRTVTTLGRLATGNRVNLEFDILARYAAGPTAGVDAEKLTRWGYL